jgi:AcrR family transcriptional regulator
MAGSSAIGRERLIDAAERLMAERGVHAVSLREITAAARQRNASGIHYHFGDRAGLIGAVIDRHMGRIDEARNAQLDALERDGRTALHDVVAALVVPLADALATPSGRRYLRIIDELVEDPTLATPQTDLTGLNRSLERAARLLAPTLRVLPRPLRASRQELCTTFLLRALAARAHALEQKRPVQLAHEDFVANLIDVLAAVLAVAPTPEARRSLRAAVARRS